jgi:hypothetical protein
MLSKSGTINVLKIFSDEECEKLIKRANIHNWELVDSDLAKYHRVIIIDENLAKEVFDRIKHVLPDEINGQKIIGLNDHFRFSRYSEGGEFKKHTDGINQDKHGNRSIMTLNIFLNNPEEGGGTIFYFNEHIERVAPVKGTGVLFSANILHEGEKLTKGVKYLIRTDVMIRDSLFDDINIKLSDLYGKKLIKSDNENTEILFDTLKIFDDNYGSIKKKALLNVKLNNNYSGKISKVMVIEEDWGDAAQLMTSHFNQIFAVLNMANAKHFGGGYEMGMSAQEENMFRRTDCHYSGFREHFQENYKDIGIYTQEMSDLINGVNGEVYLDKENPRICIKRSEKYKYQLLSSYEIFPFYELRSAALDLRHFKYDLDIIESINRRKIRAQIDTLIKKKVRHVIFGAFGCGAFRNNPKMVSRIYKEELTYKLYHFDVIVFAIYNAGYGPAENFEVFKRELSSLNT